MSQWFKDRRQEFIAASLRQFGQVRRQDLMREFDISLPQASNDIATFMAAEPPHVRYDVSAKAYVMDDPATPVSRSAVLEEALRPFARAAAAFDYWVPDVLDFAYPKAGTDTRNAIEDCPDAVGELTEEDFRRAEAAIRSLITNDGGAE